LRAGNANMFVRGNEWLMPDWIKILLDLVNYKHAPLKEIAISYIIATFSQVLQSDQIKFY
jgi:hypothetical protein